MDVFNVFEKDRKEISGPVNVLRLEGEIDGITKVVYLFLDHHNNAFNQTECLNVYATDVNQYLAQTFHKLNGSSRVYDFFMELDTSEFRVDPEQREAMRTGSKAGYRSIYIGRVVKLIRSAVEYDPKTGRTEPSKVFQNVRLHYLDIREEFYAIMFPLLHLSDGVWGMMCNKVRHFDQPIRVMQEVKARVDSIIQTYEAVLANPDTKPDSTHPHPLFAQTALKLLIGYKHTDVKQILSDLFKIKFKDFSQLSNDLEQAIDIFGKMQTLLLDPPITLKYGTSEYDIEKEQMYGSVLLDAYMIAVKISERSMVSIAWITDCYLLRRILDKDYITHSVIYSGGGHSGHYVQALVGDFGFRVTNASFSPFDTIDELNEAIRTKVKEGHAIDDLLIPSRNPPQCSDITLFPADFA